MAPREGHAVGAAAPTAGFGRPRVDAGDRPGASGHRFGPDLECSECGVLWEAHQRAPRPCSTEPTPDPFTRRPADDFDDDVAEAPRRASAASDDDV